MTIRKAIDLLVAWGWWCVGTAPAPMSPVKTCIMKPPI
jgi:hypothetical protein